VVLVRNDVSGERIASIFRLARLWIFPVRRDDMRHEERGTEPLATANPQ
jgi:hypothetical protein